MISYRSLKLEDKLWIDKIVQKSGIIASEYPFVNNFLWNDFLLLDLAARQDFFTVFSRKKKAYLFPVIKNIEDNYNNKLIEAINLLKKDAILKNRQFKLYGLTYEMKQILENLFPTQFEYINTRDSADYIYKIDDLVNLKGKKYHSKRNFINNFKMNYCDWEYKLLEKSMFAECLDLNVNWYKNKDNNDVILNYEVEMLENVFKYFDKLNLFGGVLRVNKKIIGFSIGYKINDITVDNIIEKALHDYKGSYNILCQQFLSNIPPNFIYVNREEDLGLENLKQTKLSLHPCQILDKYEAFLI